MGKIRIGICDDQREPALLLERYIRELEMSWRGDSWEIHIFSSGEELLQQAQAMSVVFLDIELGGMDGIETGRLLKQKNPECRLIMATGMEHRYKDAFRIQAFRFVTKPFDRDEIREALVAALAAVPGTALIEVFSQRVPYQIKQRDICYFEAYNGYVEATAGKQTFRKDMSLDAVESVVDGRIFYRISRQFLVNLHWVETYEKGHLVIGGKRFMVSRRKRSELEQKYIEYDIRYRENQG